MSTTMRDLLKMKPTPNSITKKCERLAALEQQLEAQSLPLTQQLAALQLQLEEQVGPLQDQISLLEKEIKRDGLALGKTIETPTHQVIYSNGRRSWDSRGLDGYMAAGHPELEQFKKVGNPSVKIKRQPPSVEG